LLNDPTYGCCAATDRLPTQLRQKLMGWSGHIASWLDQTEIPVLLVRYEDMQTETAGVLSRVMEFADLPQTRDRIKRAVGLTNFANLKKLEAANGFREKPSNMHTDFFFRRGEAGAWRDELTKDQVLRIEAVHAPMMRRLDYDLAYRAGQYKCIGEAR
jgi:aryl sulfotransferase